MKKTVCIIVLLASIFSISNVNGQAPDTTKWKNIKMRSIGPAGMSGRVTAIDVIHKNPQVIYVGTASGGLWRSESSGVRWHPLFDNQRVASIGALRINQNNTDEIWIGTGEGNPRNSQTSGYGIYKSIDRGRTWQCMGLENTRTIHRIIIDPEDTETVYVAALGSAWGNNPERGVYKTTDGGKNWEKILYIDERTGAADLVMDPSNHKKLFVAMWEYRRKPYFFESGGENSGLYVTFNGGQTWSKRTSDHGLPKGELGRIGIAIAPSNPKRVYALIEAKENALYRSDDGGFKWKKTATNVADRPFYYAELYVDPKDQNRIYNLYSRVSMSEDGGHKFRVILPYSGIHPDHHAWWIHPEDPTFLIDGNDGGLAISRDRGKTWRFVENLPLAQFYHINYDMEIPYNVYGGMQDNGSWYGPAYVWRQSGIRNCYWNEVLFGDGFDVVPDPANPRYGYAMWQGGNLVRYDRETGHSQRITPTHPEGEKLRFNWNAAIAQSPVDNATVFFGSQFLHKSTDRGQNWDIISPDLTTNNPEKQKQMQSGGLTPDVTYAENYTTITTIAPSSIDTNVIWVGTDDGNLQLTTNGGKTWQNVTNRLPGAPKESWIHQIEASKHDAGEAFVALNNYRQNDWSAYCYHTTDYGKTWQRIANDNKVWGYCLSIVQDPVAPNLLFLGTEYGLYFSFDKGKNWAKWENGYPTVSTMDMKIHPRESDLIVGTFGRAVYILDDIRPLREVALNRNIFQKTVHAFRPPVAYLSQWKQPAGVRFTGYGMYNGQNRPYGAIINYFANKKAALKDTTEKNKKDSVKIEIFNEKDTLIRTIIHTPDSIVSRLRWNLDREMVRYPHQSKPKEDAVNKGGGRKVLPGEYKLVFHYNDKKDSTVLTVKPDPRLTALDIAHLKKRNQLLERLNKDISKATHITDRLREANQTASKIAAYFSGDTNDSTVIALRDSAKAMQDTINNLLYLILPRPKKKGLVFDNSDFISKIQIATSYLRSTHQAPNNNQINQIKIIEKELAEITGTVNSFFDTKWKEFEQLYESINYTPFNQKYEPFKIEQHE